MASSSILSNARSSIGDGVSNAGKGVGQGVTDIGRGAGDVASSASQGAGNAGKTVGKGAGDVGKGVTDAGGSVVQGGAGIVGTGFSNGFELAANMSKNAFDLQRSVAGGVGGIEGTAVDGVVTAASATTGAVFDPLANSLKAVEGLESLGEGLDAINGLSVQSLQQVANATKKAIALAGQPPTFFDPDADGVVNFADTQRGFVLLGLEERYAKIAAYALHSTFTYSTADAWLTVPNVSTLPVKITNLPKTRWGKNWGNYERVDWVNDADVETFFGLRERTSWTEYWTDMKSYFGTALLIFEWGTTWPFMLPELANLDAANPVANQTVILPTIAKSHENARKASGGQKSDMPDPTPAKDSDTQKQM